MNSGRNLRTGEDAEGVVAVAVAVSNHMVLIDVIASPPSPSGRRQIRRGFCHASRPAEVMTGAALRHGLWIGLTPRSKFEFLAPT